MAATSCTRDAEKHFNRRCGFGDRHAGSGGRARYGRPFIDFDSVDNKEIRYENNAKYKKTFAHAKDSATANEMKNVMIHEMGHALGIDDHPSKSWDSIMHKSVRGWTTVHSRDKEDCKELW